MAAREFISVKWKWSLVGAPPFILSPQKKGSRPPLPDDGGLWSPPEAAVGRA